MHRAALLHPFPAQPFQASKTKLPSLVWSFSSFESRDGGREAKTLLCKPTNNGRFRQGPGQILWLHLGPAASSLSLGCCASSAWTEFGSAPELHNIKVVFVDNSNVQGRETSRSCYMFCWAFPARKGGREGENAFAKHMVWARRGSECSALPAHCYTPEDISERRAAQ